MDVNGCAVPKLWKDSCSRGHCLCLENEPLSLSWEILQRLVPWNLPLHLVVHVLIICYYIPPKSSKCTKHVAFFYIWSIICTVKVPWEAIQSELVSDECSADMSMEGGWEEPQNMVTSCDF